MTNAMWELYWLTRAIAINNALGPVSIVWLVCFLVVGGVHYLCGCNIGKYDSELDKIQKKTYVSRGLKLMAASLVGFVIFGTGYVLTPDKDEAAVIVAGGAVIAAAQSDAGQKIASKSVAVLEGSLDNILGKEAVAKAQIDVEKKVVDAVKNQMGIKDDGKGTNSPAPSGS